MGVQRLAVLAAGLAVASGVIGCGGSEKPRLSPAPSPATAASQSALAVHGALEGDLVPRGSATCTSNDVSLFGTVGKTKVSLTVFAPFAYYPGNDTISLPAPSGVDIGIRLDADRGGSPWRADAKGGAGTIRVGLTNRSGSFDADLVAADGASQVHVSGTWECA